MDATEAHDRPATEPEVEALPAAEFLMDARAVMAAIETVIDGKREAIEIATTVLLAEGHLLVEDVPGVGKTMLARALARSVDC
jgi:MoxR-like ATPase